jgi:hypothetical protein
VAGPGRHWHHGRPVPGRLASPAVTATGMIKNYSWTLLAEDSHHHAA